MVDAVRPAHRLRLPNFGFSMTTIEHNTPSEAKASRRRKPRGLRFIRQAPRYFAIWRRFRDSTLLGRDAYLVNLYLADKHLADPRLQEGCVVECGTWRGGMAAGLSLIGGPGRHYYFFDSFEGLPPAGVEDGDYAKRWQAHRGGTIYTDNCTASYDEFAATMARVRLPATQLHVHKGFFESTFPAVDVPPVALLRLDADWYRSTMICLEKFWDRLLPGALVLIDDYYAWEGCRKAIHAFLAQRGAVEAIRQSRLGKVAYLVRA
jgi:O-methyltransferase